MTEATPHTRSDRLRHWAAANHGLPEASLNLQLAAGDASFRRYFRLRLPDGTTRMLMDAPPQQEDSRPFVNIARNWRAAGLPVPKLHAEDLSAGFLELDDLGDTPLQARFHGDDHPETLAWQDRAIDLVHELQTRADTTMLPPYDATLFERELDLFPDWCLGEWLGIEVPECWMMLREALVASALDQPVVTVHRDFDAMNLMVHGEKLYLIDFQDAVAGPISYDLISLLRGRYCRFTPARFAAWVEDFRRCAIADGRLPGALAEATFLRQANAMAAQRCLKVLGIFCRLTLRDTRQGYLERLPHFLGHLEDSLIALPEHGDFTAWLAAEFRPALSRRLDALSFGEET